MANTDKHYTVSYVPSEMDHERRGDVFTNYDAALAYATRQAAKDADQDVYHVFETITTVVGTPPTNVVVTKL